MIRGARFVPLMAVAILILIAAWRLAAPDDSTIHSRLVGQPVPAFALPQAVPRKPALRSADLATGQPRLINIFASWCVPCIAEAPILGELKRRGVRIDGIAIRDRSEDVAAFLRNHGDPFERIGSDKNSGVQLALGSSGVPESFVIDGWGVIRYHHVGPIAEPEMATIVAELEKAR